MYDADISDVDWEEDSLPVEEDCFENDPTPEEEEAMAAEALDIYERNHEVPD